MGKFHRYSRGVRRLFHVPLRFAAIGGVYDSRVQDLFANDSQNAYLTGVPRRAFARKFKDDPLCRSRLSRR
jgi:hypothetical protein